MTSLDDRLLEIVPGKEIINPPPEVRAIIDKTANFIGTRGGHELEDKIREKERTNPKFCFLNVGDPYFDYYQMKLHEIKERALLNEGEDGDGGDGGVGVGSGGVLVEEVKIEKKPRKKIPKQPPTLDFVADTPRISSIDMDIIKLTALFVARNGKQFMTQLAQRESRNYQFDFLKSNHSCFKYFTRLVEQYTKILLPPTDLKHRLMARTDKFKVLERCVERSEWERFATEMQREREKEEESEKSNDISYNPKTLRWMFIVVAFLSIDWHDFVVVQTIEYSEIDLKSQLPVPTSKEALESMPLAQRRSIMGSTQQNPIPKQDNPSGKVDVGNGVGIGGSAESGNGNGDEEEADMEMD